jgi:hypothetical protein
MSGSRIRSIFSPTADSRVAASRRSSMPEYEYTFSALHLELGHLSTQSACLKRANNQHRCLLPVNRRCSRSRRVLLSRSSEQASQVTYIL